MSDRILICSICGKEKPDFDIKSQFGIYGSTDFANNFYCPYCHGKTSTIIKSSKGTPETSYYNFEIFSACADGHSHTEYGDKSTADFIEEVEKIRYSKNRVERLRKESEKEYEDKMNQLEQSVDKKYKIVYEAFLKVYNSREKAYEALNKWLNQEK